MKPAAQLRLATSAASGRVVALLLAGLALSLPVSAAEPLFAQTATSGSAPSSMLWPNGSDVDSQIWDNFLLKTGAQVTGVQWWGTSPAAVSAFELTFYTDISAIAYNQQHFGYTPASALQPDVGTSPLRTVTLALADLQVTQVSASLWQFTANLSGGPAFALNGQQSYWLGVQAHEAPSNAWSWALAAGDSLAFGKGGTFGAGDYRFYVNRQDFAFQIDGTPAAVPEPATGVLMLAGLALALCKTRRRNA